MKISRKRVALGALVLLAAAGAATGQDVPESILPPGFNDPVAPTPTPSPGATPAPGVGPIAPGTPLDGLPTPSPTPTSTDTPVPIDLAAYELPASAMRTLAAVGPDAAGLTGASFGTARGRWTEVVMRRLDAPLPSRWLSIALRRALVSRVDTPEGVNGADFAAERAWLLLRMGEANAARALVQSVDVDNYTPKLVQVAMQSMLANGDPAGLCPLVEPASRMSGDQAWAFARAMCSALGGKPVEAGVELDNARRRTGRTSIDALLAEKVVGAGAQGRRAVTIEWAGVDRLTAWRFGLATATGVELPDDLLSGTRPQVALWRATAPMLEPAVRVGFADAAATRGVLSSAALVDLYGEIEASDDSGTNAGALGRDLRAAYSDSSEGDRLSTLKRIWDVPAAGDRYARLILTARAAATIRPATERAEDSTRLISAMLAAGMDRHAMRWRGIVPAASDGWAMLALANPEGAAISSGDVDSYAGTERDKARMLLAAATGLGRLPLGEAQQLAQSLDVRFGVENAWTRAIQAAAERREAGSVLLLFAAGMQTASWRGVPPEVLFHGIAALRAVGLEGEARMIAAEAIARL